MRNRLLPIALGVLAIQALVFSPAGDQGFLAIVLFGPLISGAAAAALHRSWRVVAWSWAVSGLFWLVLDWAVNDEDQLFHLVIAAVTYGLTALGAWLSRLLGASRAASTSAPLP
jgi:hypothetical protein